eukprot:1806759-Amphidinium_carterae.1
MRRGCGRRSCLGSSDRFPAWSGTVCSRTRPASCLRGELVSSRLPKRSGIERQRPASGTPGQRSGIERQRPAS